MGLSYDDLSLLRFIQKRQSIPLGQRADQPLLCGPHD